MSDFKRAKVMMVAISAMLAQGMDMAAIANSVGPYVSRGKGRGTPSKNYFRGNASKYMPHQGKQEIARRFARMQKSLESA